MILDFNSISSLSTNHMLIKSLGYTPQTFQIILKDYRETTSKDAVIKEDIRKSNGKKKK